MESCYLVQAFLSALQNQCPGFPPVCSLDMELFWSVGVSAVVPVGQELTSTALSMVWWMCVFTT